MGEASKKANNFKMPGQDSGVSIALAKKIMTEIMCMAKFFS